MSKKVYSRDFKKGLKVVPIVAEPDEWDKLKGYARIVGFTSGSEAIRSLMVDFNKSVEKKIRDKGDGNDKQTN